MKLSLDLSLLGAAGTNNAAIPPLARILSTQPVACWPMGESGGTSGVDATGNGHNGVYGRDVSLMGTQAGPFAGTTAPVFNGSSDYLDVFSTALRTALGNMQSGTVMAWAKVSDVADWTEGAERRIFALYDGSFTNQVYLRKATANNLWQYNYSANGVSKLNGTSDGTGDAAWHQVTLTWSLNDDVARFYVDESPAGSAPTGLGTWNGTISTMLVGITTTGGIHPWKGGLAFPTIWDRALSPAEVASLPRAN